MSSIEKPPRTGAGSGRDAWLEYAKEVTGLDHFDDMNRADIIEYLEDGGYFESVEPDGDIEAETVPDDEAETNKPAVTLFKLRAAARGMPYEGVELVQQALVKERFLAQRYVNGRFGTMTTRAYSKWQRRLGFRGRDASGTPELTSLVRLGDKHGFDVID